MELASFDQYVKNHGKIFRNNEKGYKKFIDNLGHYPWEYNLGEFGALHMLSGNFPSNEFASVYFSLLEMEKKRFESIEWRPGEKPLEYMTDKKREDFWNETKRMLI